MVEAELGQRKDSPRGDTARRTRPRRGRTVQRVRKVDTGSGNLPSGLVTCAKLGIVGFLGTYTLATGLQLLLLGLARGRLWDAFVESFEVCRQLVKSGRDVELYRCTLLNFKSSPEVEKLKIMLEAVGFATGLGVHLVADQSAGKLGRGQLVALATGTGVATGVATIANPRLLLDTVLDRLAYRWFRQLYRKLKSTSTV